MKRWISIQSPSTKKNMFGIKGDTTRNSTLPVDKHNIIELQPAVSSPEGGEKNILSETETSSALSVEEKRLNVSSTDVDPSRFFQKNDVPFYSPMEEIVAWERKLYLWIDTGYKGTSKTNTEIVITIRRRNIHNHLLLMSPMYQHIVDARIEARTTTLKVKCLKVLNGDKKAKKLKGAAYPSEEVIMECLEDFFHGLKWISCSNWQRCTKMEMKTIHDWKKVLPPADDLFIIIYRYWHILEESTEAEKHEWIKKTIGEENYGKLTQILLSAYNTDVLPFHTLFFHLIQCSREHPPHTKWKWGGELEKFIHEHAKTVEISEPGVLLGLRDEAGTPTTKAEEKELQHTASEEEEDETILPQEKSEKRLIACVIDKDVNSALFFQDISDYVYDQEPCDLHIGTYHCKNKGRITVQIDNVTCVINGYLVPKFIKSLSPCKLPFTPIVEDPDSMKEKKKPLGNLSCLKIHSNEYLFTMILLPPREPNVNINFEDSIIFYEGINGLQESNANSLSDTKFCIISFTSLSEPPLLSDIPTEESVGNSPITDEKNSIRMNEPSSLQKKDETTENKQKEENLLEIVPPPQKLYTPIEAIAALRYHTNNSLGEVLTNLSERLLLQFSNPVIQTLSENGLELDSIECAKPTSIVGKKIDVEIRTIEDRKKKIIPMFATSTLTHHILDYGYPDHHGKKYASILIDLQSKWLDVMAIHTPNIAIYHVKKYLEKAPGVKSIATDNSSCFHENSYTSFLKEHRIKHPITKRNDIGKSYAQNIIARINLALNFLELSSTYWTFGLLAACTAHNMMSRRGASPCVKKYSKPDGLHLLPFDMVASNDSIGVYLGRTMDGKVGIISVHIVSMALEFVEEGSLFVYPRSSQNPIVRARSLMKTLTK